MPRERRRSANFYRGGEGVISREGEGWGNSRSIRRLQSSGGKHRKKELGRKKKRGSQRLWV